MRMLKQSTAANVMVFMTDSSDHITGKTGLTLTITASKDGAAFASITPTVTERGNGWYSLALTTAHTDTLGDLAVHVTGSGADPSDFLNRVIAVDLADSVRAGLTALPNAAANANGGLPILSSSGTTLAYTVSTVTTLTNLPAITTDWLTGTGVAASAVTKIQSGLATPTNITAATGIVLAGVTHTGAVIPTVTTVTNQLTAAQIATGVWQDATAGDFTVASSIGKCLYVGNVAPGAAGGHFIAGVNAATTVTTSFTTTFTGNLTGSVASVTGNVGGNVTGSVGSVTAAITLPTIPTDWISAAGVSAAAVTKIQLGLATPTNITSATGIILASGTHTGAVIPNVTAVGSVTGNIGGNVIGSVGAIGTGGIASNSFATGAITAGVIAADAIGASELAADAIAEIAAGTWDLATSGHTTGGTFGAAAVAAGGAGDPWSTSLPGSYAAGTAGYLVGTYLDAAVSSSGGGLDAAGMRAALGMASANLDTQLGTIDGNVDSILTTTSANLDAAVSSRLAPTVSGRTLDVTATGEAGVDWGNVGNQTAAVNLSATTVSTGQTIAAVSGSVGSISAAITLPSIPANWITAAGIAADAIGASELSASAVAAIADGLLGRNIGGGLDGGRTVQSALYFLRNKFTIVGPTMTVYEIDDSTVSWTSTVATTAGDPISSSNPA